MEKKVKEIEFQSHIDERGNLIIIEESKNLPFTPRRMFYISNVKDDKTRGNHANIDSEFVMIALQGEVTVCIDDGKVKNEYILNNQAKGLYIPNMTWKTMYNFSSDAILLVIANTLYNKEEYINDYNEFLKKVGV